MGLGGLFGGKGGGSQKQTTTSEPWKPAQGGLQNILNDAMDYYNKQGGTDPNNKINVAEMNDYLKNALSQMGGGINQDLSNQAQQGINAGQGSLSGAGGLFNQIAGQNTQSIADRAGALVDNDLLNQQVDAANQNIFNNLRQNTYGAINADAISAGGLSGGRVGRERGFALGNAVAGANQNELNLRGNAYNNAINTVLQQDQQKLNAAGGLAGVGSSQIAGTGALGMLGGWNQQNLQNGLNAGNIQQIYDQSKLDTDYKNANAGWGNLQNLLNIYGTIGGMGGTNTTTTTGGGKGGGLLSGIAGGAMSGYGVGGGWGALIGGGLGALGSM